MFRVKSALVVAGAACLVTLAQGQQTHDLTAFPTTGWLTNGQKFDSSKDRMQPFEVEVGRGRVIEGWDVTLAQMRVGDHVKVTIPSELAYGSRSPGAGIPPNATLVFDVELLSVR